MKKFILTISFILFVLNVFGQDYSKLANATFPDAESYKKSEKQVLECADYIVNSPYDSKDVNRLLAIQYIIKWMSGTPDYMFDIDAKATKLIKSKMELNTIYFAAMAKVVLENSGSKYSADEITDKAIDILVSYCSKPENNIKPTRAIKKIIKKRKL